MKVEAIRVSRHGGPEVLEVVEVDVGDPGAGQVRIRNRAIGVNYLDIYNRTGLYATPLPHGLGNEGAGVIEAVGPGVEGLKEGDRVAYGHGPIGAYASARVVPAAMLVKLPDSVDFETAAAIMLKGLTVQYLFRQVYRLQGNETILFHAAAGGVGLIACQWARALGTRLIGTVSSPQKARLAQENGAWATIDYSKENFVGRVLELTNGAKVPVVFDGVGKDTWEGSLDCLQTMGLMVSFGNASGPVTGVNLGILAQKGSLFVTRPTLATFVAPRSRLLASCEELFDHVARGRIKVRIERRYPLAEAARAHQDLEGRATTGSLVLVPRA
ncbi:MAG TPA: quinone oxidoreductase [Burkholderiaceae bacterium]|nr:quinone oxidoreductase [Burkholderiaceae bacterium]